MITERERQLMIDAYCLGVIQERITTPQGVIVDGNYTTKPIDMAEKWINELIEATRNESDK